MTIMNNYQSLVSNIGKILQQGIRYEAFLSDLSKMADSVCRIKLESLCPEVFVKLLQV
jgi:hypothetical protein